METYFHLPKQKKRVALSRSQPSPHKMTKGGQIRSHCLSIIQSECQKKQEEEGHGEGEEVDMTQ